MNRPYIIFPLSALVGFISLSQEIIWFRTLTYATAGDPKTFSYMLGFFLLGIAFGAWLAQYIIDRKRVNGFLFIFASLIASSIILYFSIILVSIIFTFNSELAYIMSYLSVCVSSLLLGGIFPMLCHLGIKSPKNVGVSVSRVYLANIVGSTAGPLATGFVLMEMFRLDVIIAFFAVLSAALGLALFLLSEKRPGAKASMAGGLVTLFLVIGFSHGTLYHETLEKLQYKENYGNHAQYKYVYQNRSGIIAIEESAEDIIYGGGIYDGRFNTNPLIRSNGINRCYIIAALHPDPREVLEIGLSSGSWAKVIASYRKVKSLEIIEINQGYLEAVGEYPENAEIFNDPKVKIHFDDGRRWLTRNKERRFDIIVMNTTFHWRMYITNLVSEEFLRLAKSRLKPGGVLYYNSTGSQDIPRTAAKVFKYVGMYSSFVAASDVPFALEPKDIGANLLLFINDGKPVFDLSQPQYRKVFNELAQNVIEDKAADYRAESDTRIITDDNMVTEFTSAIDIYKPKWSWLNLFRRR
ncbi:hypothetical protein MNBD_NITROSPINAE02-2212 [hydrothermal vent metagenome]|uniref:Spermidine synthase n=1 Tax=hydrothermal vent metagenome TaxID=652676 RepID=A0A3B1D5J3_9ZZZZ